jgi:16S rRNA (cytosine967-C5)-methyltransferase
MLTNRATSPSLLRWNRQSPNRGNHLEDISGLAARKAALKLLDAVLRRGQPLELALHAATQGMARADDKALAHALASETLRWLNDFDAMIDSATQQRLADDAKGRMVLRLMLCQALALRTAPYAVVASSLPLLTGGVRRLAHGVFGSLMRRNVALPDMPQLPQELHTRWQTAWGEEMCAAARTALKAAHFLDLTLKQPQETAHYADILGGTSMRAGHVRIAQPKKLTELAGFAEGAWWVQNASAALPASLLGAGQGRAALDICAAPGGKTMQMAANGWHVTAVDKSAKRLERLGDNVKRLGLNAERVTADVTLWQPDRLYDAILLDAPCSATGIFQRHPDVLHRVTRKDIQELTALQSALLARVAQWLKPNGRLVYAVCSLEPEEGEAHMAQLAAYGLELDSVQAHELPESISAASQGWIRILPHKGYDGFFMARLRRMV